MGEDGSVEIDTVRRRKRIGITLAVLGALLAPVVLDRDGLPLSTYPMYAFPRRGESTIVTAQGITEEGAPRTLTPTIIGGSDDPLIVVGELRAALARDRGDERCRQIAGRVGARSELDDVTDIEIVSERHDTVARTSGDDSLLDRTVRARCEVDRP